MAVVMPKYFFQNRAIDMRELRIQAGVVRSFQRAVSEVANLERDAGYGPAAGLQRQDREGEPVMTVRRIAIELERIHVEPTAE